MEVDVQLPAVLEADAMKRVPITYEFNAAELPIGKMELAPEISELAKHVLEHPGDYVFEPGFIEHPDGSLELIEISAVLRARKDGVNVWRKA